MAMKKSAKKMKPVMVPVRKMPKQQYEALVALAEQSRSSCVMVAKKNKATRKSPPCKYVVELRLTKLEQKGLRRLLDCGAETTEAAIKQALRTCANKHNAISL